MVSLPSRIQRLLIIIENANRQLKNTITHRHPPPENKKRTQKIQNYNNLPLPLKPSQESYPQPPPPPPLPNSYSASRLQPPSYHPWPQPLYS